MQGNSKARPSGGNGASRPERDGISELVARIELVQLIGQHTRLTRRGSAWWGCCPMHGESTPSLKVNPRLQRFICFGCGARGDALDFLAAAEGLPTAEAIPRLRQLAGDTTPSGPPSRLPPAVIREQEQAARKKAHVQALGFYGSCRPVLPGTLAAAYLEHRACDLPHPDGDLRYHLEARHPSGHVGPALVALVTDAITGEPMTVHRTWLAEDGRGKAQLDTPRLLWSGLPKVGGVVRLWHDEEITLGLAVAEGIETALSFAQGFGLAWATIDAANLAALPVLDGIEALTIAADHDQVGLAAAEECACRWGAVKKEVRIWRSPTPGEDFNDRAREIAA